MKYFVVLISIVMLSCENHEKKVFSSNDFPQIESKIIIDKDINIPFKSLVQNNTLYISDRSNRPSVSIFDVSDKYNPEFIAGVGREGRAGGEFLAPDFIVENYKEDTVLVFDAGGRKLVQIDENDSVLTYDLTFRMNGMPTNMHVIDSAKFIVTGIIPGSKFSIVEIDGTDITRIKSIGELISLNDEFSGFHEANAWRSQSVYLKSEKRIALFSSFAKRADLFNVDGELLKTVKDEEHHIPRVGLRGSEFVFERDAVIAYVSVASDSDYIYALYSGHNYGSEGADNGQYIHVFDWDMNFISGFQLDHHSLNISTDGNKGIYSTQQHPDVAIRYFDISGKI